MFRKEGGVFVGGRTENAKPEGQRQQSGRGVCRGDLHTVSLPHIMIRILVMAIPAHQYKLTSRGGENIPVRLQQLLLDPEGSSVTKNICPSLTREINRNHDAYTRVMRRTRWKDRLGLVLLGKE